MATPRDSNSALASLEAASVRPLSFARPEETGGLDGTAAAPATHKKGNGQEQTFAETQLNKKRCQLIMSFYRGLKFFRDSFDEHSRRRISYHRVDYLIETYFRTVKDLSHQFFKDGEQSTYMRLLQVTFDLSFGFVFHMLLKFKETLRLQENYNIDRLSSIVDRLQKTASDDLVDVPKLFNSLRQSYERDVAVFDEELKRTRDSLDELEEVFSKIIAVYADNTTILRTLYSNHAFFLKLFPGQGVDRIFRHIYPEAGPAYAYIVLGFDFIRSGHLRMAERAFRRALRRRSQEKNKGPADLLELYRMRRGLFVGANPEAVPEAARRLKAVESFEAEYQIAENTFR